MIAAAVATVAFVATPQLMVAMKSGSPLQGGAVVASAEQVKSLKTSGEPLAAVQVATVTATMPEGVVLRDPRIDDYLLAHQRFSPSMYSTAQFARSATFETAPGK
jgi:sigma-E factor negative regulatory protein RseA